MRKKYLYLFNHKKEYHKKITFLLTKARTCFQVSMHLQVFFVANPFRLRTRRARDIRCART
jgi:hypothetical protein